MRLFSIGVPVIANVTSARRSRAARYALVWLFLTNCASSRTRPAHSTSANSASSRRSSVYEVMTRSADAAASVTAIPRFARVASTTATRRSGVKRAASLRQVDRTEVGATTRKGRVSPASRGVRDEREHLERLAEPHVVGEDRRRAGAATGRRAIRSRCAGTGAAARAARAAAASEGSDRRRGALRRSAASSRRARPRLPHPRSPPRVPSGSG